MRTPTTFRFSLQFVFIAILLSGCGQEKESLHEHEHDAPRHWPNDMAEAAKFIESRVRQLSESTTKSPEAIEVELRDLVEWAPEVAAETELQEKDWLPIYELSEAIRKHLKDVKVAPQDLAGDFDKLAGLLRDAHEKVLADAEVLSGADDEQPQ